MGGGGEHPEPVMQVTVEEMRAAGVPLAYRDFCAHMLIPLNKCRRKNYFLPWRCVDERHTYEKCQYEHYLRRVEDMTKQQREKRLAERAERDAKELAEAREAAGLGPK